METTRTGRFWIALGSPRAVRIIYVVMLAYALVIGGLMLGYTSVQSCIADYTELSANALQVRTQASTDDRLLTQRVEAVDQSDRTRIIANQQSLAKLIQAAINNNGQATAKALQDFQITNNVSLDIFAKNEKERSSIAAQRANIDATRANNPLPGPPSEQC